MTIAAVMGMIAVLALVFSGPHYLIYGLPLSPAALYLIALSRNFSLARTLIYTTILGFALGALLPLFL